MMKNWIPFLMAVTLLFRSVGQGQTISGISSQNGNVVLSVTNANSLLYAGLYGTWYVQSSPELSSPNNWNNLAVDSWPGTVSIPVTNSTCFFRAAPFLPLFQFAIFYNLDMEIASAATLSVQGPVFSDGGIWSGSTAITFASTVSAVGLVSNTNADPFRAGYSGSGSSSYSLAGQPTSGNTPLVLSSAGVASADPKAFLNLPPTNCSLNTTGAYSSAGQFYLANEVDLYVTNCGTNDGWNSGRAVGAPIALYYQDAANEPNYLTWVTNDFYLVSNMTVGIFYSTNQVPIYSSAYSSAFQATNGFLFTNNVTTLRFTNTSGPFVGTNIVWYMGYSFLTNVLFYDWREGWNLGNGPPKTIQAVQLDLRALNRWMTNSAAGNSVYGGSNYNAECESPSHKSHPINTIYFFNSVPPTATTLPAVRVVNGGMIPPNMGSSGFSLATPMPLYVLGDYNISNSLGSSISQNSTAYTEPSALMADSITVLSDEWKDTNSLAKHTGGPSATQTTINAACIAGIVPSDINNPASESTSDGYSGGVENYFRLLENWTAAAFWFNGSIVAMFPSEYATNCWQQPGYYYIAPYRSWAFDTNFMSGSGLPPLTPTVTFP